MSSLLILRWSMCLHFSWNKDFLFLLSVRQNSFKGRGLGNSSTRNSGSISSTSSIFVICLKYLWVSSCVFWSLDFDSLCLTNCRCELSEELTSSGELKSQVSYIHSLEYFLRPLTLLNLIIRAFLSKFGMKFCQDNLLRAGVFVRHIPIQNGRPVGEPQNGVHPTI